MATINQNQKIQNTMINSQKISKQRIIGAIKTFIGDDGFIEDHGVDEELHLHDITFSRHDDYRYIFRIDTKESIYLSVILSFGDMNGFINSNQMEVLRNTTFESNKEFRCIRGVLSEDEDIITKNKEMNFSVRYDSYCLPGITASQIIQHINMALAGIEQYVGDTLDLARSAE
ncbi:hypothetical protein [Enterobacter mori]